MTDLQSQKQRIDIVALTGRDTRLKRIASTGGGEYAGPCPRCGGRDRFHVNVSGWWFCRRCHPKRGDVIEYVRWRDGVDFKTACERLGVVLEREGRTASPAAASKPAPARPVPRAAPPNPAWQARARAFLEQAEHTLWSEAGRRALAYLREKRGLTDETIRRRRLGFHPQDAWEERETWGLAPAVEGGKPKRVWLPRGIVIPCIVEGDIWYVKVRRATGKPKYLNVAGGEPALFGIETLEGKRVAVLTEGEFDAMLLHQEAGDLVGVATMGGVQTRPAGRWALALLPLRRILIAFDGDAVGNTWAKHLLWEIARAERLPLPPGMDVTDYYLSGGDLRAWVMKGIEEKESGNRDDLDEIFLAGSALLDRLRDRIRRYALYDRLEDAYLAEDREALLAVFSEIAAAVEERKPHQPALWPVE